MYGYIYRIHNSINSKMYIGKHKSSKIDENYLGSSPILKKSIKKYGKDKFHIEILEWCESEIALNNREIYWINYYDAVNSDMYYNLNCGGLGGFDYINRNHLQPQLNKETHPMYNKLGDKNPNFGKKHSEYAKQKISNARVGTKCITDGISNKYIKSGDCIPSGWSLGMTKTKNHSETQRVLQSNNIKGRKFIHNNVETKLVKECELNNFLSNGYTLGKHPNSVHKMSTMYNKKHTELTKQKMSDKRKGNFLWVNNGTVNTRVKPNELDSYLSDGWVRGRVKN